jgi:hemolysin activation/secretion protein
MFSQPLRALVGQKIRYAWVGLLGLSVSLSPVPTPAQTLVANPSGFDTAQVPFQPPVRDNLPPSLQPLPEPIPSPAPQPPTVQPPAVPVAPQPELQPGEIPTTIQVKQFRVTGSTVFSDQELETVTQPFINKPLTFSQLLQVSAAITQLYVDQGYITSGAYIQPQTIAEGVVEIVVQEGTLEDIQVEGLKRLNPNYVRSRIALGTRKPLNRDRLVAALELLKLNPLIERISANLLAGNTPGSNILKVAVEEAQSLHLSVSADNGRTPSVGSFRRGLQFRNANLLGQGDEVFMAYTNTDGSNAVDTRYTYPINARNGTLSFAYGISFSNVIESPFNTLDINSQSSYYELTLRQPVLQSPKQELGLGLTLSRRASESTFFDGLLPFPTLGADNEGKTRIWALRFFQDWTRRSNNQVFALRSQLSYGLGAFDATLNKSAPDSRFWVWRGQGQWVRQIAPDTLFLARTDLQVADRALVSLEQYGLGGFDNIRGYRQDTLLTDSGALFSAEARIPILRLRKVKSLLQITPFFDVGTAWNRSGRPQPDPTTIAGIGAGLRWQTSDRLTARLEWGIPLIPVESSNRTWQENGVYFSVIVNPF